MNVQTGHASGYQNKPGYSAPEIYFLGLYAGFKANNFHLKLGNHYHVIHDVGTPKKLSLFFKNQWLSHLPWFLLAKLLPPSTVPYPSFSRGFPSLSRAFGDAPDCNPHPVMIDHSLLKGRLSVQTACIENHPVWQITASPPTSSSETQAVKGDSLSAWLSLWKLLNDTNTSTLFLRPWREDQLNHLQAILCQTNPLTEHKKCQSVLIDFPMNHTKPWLLPELAKKDIISADGQTALDSHSIKRVNQAIDCLSSHDKLFGEPNKSKPADKAKIHACQNNHWLYQWSDQSWLYQPGIPETVIKPSPALMTGRYFNLWALEKVSPGNDTYPAWSRSSLFIARNDRHRKYHFWGAGDPVLVMGFADAPYNVEDHYAGRDGPVIGTLVESEHLNLATLLMNTVTSTPFNFYQWRGIVSGFTAPIPKSLSARVREQILSDPGSLYQFVKRQPELLSNVLTYLNREFPGHPVNSYFSGRVSLFFSHQTNANPLALVPKTSNAFDGFHPPAIPHQPDRSLPSTGFTPGIMTASGVQGNNGPPASQSRPGYPSEQKAKKSSEKSKRRAKSDGRNNIDDNEPPPPDRKHPVTPADAVSSASLLKHLFYLYRRSGLRPERVTHRSDFLSEQLGITSREKFETLLRLCKPPDCGSETLYNQMLRGFDPKNQQHMMLASKALEHSIQVIVTDGQGYLSYSYHDHTPQEPLDGLENIHMFLFHENHTVKLSHQSDDNPWFTHFLIGSCLNKQENEWLEDNALENALWELFPQWQKDILLCRGTLRCNAIKSASELLEEASIQSASEVLQQAFTAPDKFMQGDLGHHLFRFYNKLRLVCYPFDDTENPDGTFYVSKNVLGAVVFFWQESASNYIAFIAPDLSTSAINDKIQSLDNHVKDYSEAVFLVKKQDIRYVIPALLVLAPVFRKTYAEAESIISDTEDALVYGGLARWQHLSSLFKPIELGKVPVTNNIDLAVENIKSLEKISASIEEKLTRALPGTTVRRNNFHTIVLASPKELHRRGLLHTLKIHCFPDKNKENTITFAACKTKKWRILSINISAGPEGYFDFTRVEPFATSSRLLMPSLPAMVEKLLQDTQPDQTNLGIDAKRRGQNAQNILKILLANDTEQQVQAMIQQSLLSHSSESSGLPEFLLPYIKPQPDKALESNSEAENDASDPNSMVAAQTKITAPAALVPLADNAPDQKIIDEHATVSTATYVEGAEAITKDSSFNSHEKKQKQKEINDITIVPERNDITVKASPDDQCSTVAHNSEAVAPDPAERSNKRKNKTAAQKSIPNTIDFETALSQSEEISNWLKEMDHSFADELNRTIKTQDCKASLESEAPAESPAPDTESDTLQKQLQDGKTKTLKTLACSGASADTSADQPVITINLANTPGNQQRKDLEQAAYENHFPYAQLVQALFILNQKFPSGKPEVLQIYEKTFELLLPAAIAGIPLAYQLLIGMQLHNQHPAGWPQMEPVNRLLRSMASRATSFNQVKVEGLSNGGFLEQLYQDTDAITLIRIEQGLAKASDLSDRGREVKAIVNALREPDTASILTSLKAVRPGTRELQQTIGLLILILEKKQEPAAGQIRSELWSYSLKTLQIKGALKKKSQLMDTFYFPNVLAMTDLKAFMDTEQTGQQLKHHQPRLIAFWKVGFWESYLKASLSEDSKSEKEIFDGHHDQISNKAIKKSRPDLIKDWILARSLLLSRDFIQIKEVPASPTPAQLTSGTGTHSEKAKRTVKAARQPTDLKPGIRPSTGPHNEQVFNQYLLQLDNNIIQELRLIQTNPEKFLQQAEKQITAFRKAVIRNGNNLTNRLGIGYYYFLKALAMMDAKMSNDNKTIELFFGPKVKLNAKRINETILLSGDHGFPYAPILLLFFEYAMEVECEATSRAIYSAFSGVSQSIEILLESDSDLMVMIGVLLKWLILIPKPFGLKLAFDAETYMKNPQSNIPGKVTPSIRILREFMEQLPIKGSDGSVDIVLSRMDQQYTITQHLRNGQNERSLVKAGTAAAVVATLKEAAAVREASAIREAENAAAVAIELADTKATAAAIAIAEAKAEKKPEGRAPGESVATAIAETRAAVRAAAKAKIVAESNAEAKAKVAAESKEVTKAAAAAEARLQAEADKEAVLRLTLYFASGRSELLDFDYLDLSMLTIYYSVFGLASNPKIYVSLKEAQRKLTKDIDPNTRAMSDIIKLAFYLVSESPEVEPDLPHLKALPFEIQARLTALHFGHDLGLLTKIIHLLPGMVAHDTISYWYNTFFLIHEYILALIGGNAEKAKKLQIDYYDWETFHKRFQHFIWHKPVNTVASRIESKIIEHIVFNHDHLKMFRAGNESIFIMAIQQARKVGYEKLKQQLEQYEMDSQSSEISGWLHCLAGLTLLEAQISSDFQQVILTGHKRVMLRAHTHFRKARHLNFPYAGYLQSLVAMRLDNYQYYQDETSEAWQTEQDNKPVIQYASARKPGEKIFIEAGKIVTDILPGLLASSLYGVRFAVEAAIRVFTDKRFNLLHIPQAGWPTLIAKHFLITPIHHNIQFVFSNDVPEVEEALFQSKSDPESIERILLEPMEKARLFPINQRIKQYSFWLNSEIKSGDRPKNIKNYLSLVKIFLSDKSEALDTSSEATASDIDRLPETIARYELSRYDYTNLFKALRETPQPDTGFDDYVYNLPQLKSHPNYEAISNALLKKHRTKSALIHYYFWAYETLNDSCDNERDLFWDGIMRQKIEKDEKMKSVFVALLATADLTLMYDDNRMAVRTAFKQYNLKISFWMTLFHFFSHASDLFLQGSEQENGDEMLMFIKNQIRMFDL
ncbi:hypothetical protein [Endozoicomonas sp. 8E]|uniref:hypothetical protein n=1 Tax=Endozoicomonas sp. 8E TaxID=3035692 RepID=UPI002939128D|nr:hypothetical protein [Endozoicomonas sp. 8E]WOG25710.1 hypothetical protein P6910_14105 [Endozoicomonas sp. 8E]